MATSKEVRVPDIGNFSDVEIIEIPVKVGDVINADDTMIVLESDKATMDIPAPCGGKITALKVKVGDKVGEGSLVMTVEAAEGEAQAAPAPAAALATAPPPPASVAVETSEKSAPAPAVLAAPVAATSTKAHASPSVRAFARELGVDLTLVNGSGPKRRILKNDVQAFVKAELGKPRGGAAGGLAFGLPDMPAVDFAKFGPVESKPLAKIKKLSGANLHRNWVAAPHVTQFDEADITEMDAFRKSMADEYRAQGIRITPIVFLIKAVVAALKAFPQFNSSLSPDGESLVMKNYFHIGVAVDTPDGLVVPVLRDADRKGLVELAQELAALSQRARDKKIGPVEMQGGCFTISSLGGIGGTYFTPILNLPEVAILGVSRSSVKPVYQDGQFVPRLILPLSLSYDHRVIDGAQGARFSRYLSMLLGDVRRLLL
ncbi:MAG: dihydrolipoyllysine-residue acetyltransferase [Burkholderiales bacterium]